MTAISARFIEVFGPVPHIRRRYDRKLAMFKALAPRMKPGYRRQRAEQLREQRIEQRMDQEAAEWLAKRRN